MLVVINKVPVRYFPFANYTAEFEILHATLSTLFHKNPGHFKKIARGMHNFI